jgi:Lon protease-like protein
LDPIPDTWPPGGESAPRPVVPLFPLVNVWLFPGALLPLHIFEPRYCSMVEDILDGPGRIVMGTVVEGHEGEMEGKPPVHPIAGLGEIVNHERLPDGRFHLRLFGLGRVRLFEEESDSAYRKVSIEPLVEATVPASEEEELRERLLDAVRENSESSRAIPKQVPFATLVDLLLLRLDLPHSELQELYAEPDPVRRARGALSKLD